MVVTVNELKAHLRVDSNDEDNLLSNMIYASQGHIENLMGQAFADITGETPAPLKQAVLMLAAHWFEGREAAATEPVRSIPFSVQDLVAEYREYSFE